MCRVVKKKKEEEKEEEKKRKKERREETPLPTSPRRATSEATVLQTFFTVFAAVRCRPGGARPTLRREEETTKLCIKARRVRKKKGGRTPRKKQEPHVSRRATHVVQRTCDTCIFTCTILQETRHYQCTSPGRTGGRSS